jgi:hypothetical protein
MLLPEDKEPAVQCMKPGIQEEEREMAREARVEDQLRSEREATLIEERLSPGEYRMAVDEKMVVLDEDPPSPKEARAIMADAPLVEGVALEKNAVVVPSGRLVTQVSADASVHEGQLLDVEIPEVGQTELVSANPTVSGTVQFPSPYIPHAPFVPGVVVGVPTVQRSIMIPTPSSPIRTLPHYDFESPSVSPSQQATLPTSPTQPRHHFRPQYTLPPLKSLPVEFNRKGKLTKQQRKREKERERIEKVSEKVEGHKEKDEWAPMCLNKWGATIRANPVWKRVARASKCLSTREWSVCDNIYRLASMLNFTLDR